MKQSSGIQWDSDEVHGRDPKQPRSELEKIREAWPASGLTTHQLSEITGP